MSNKKSLICDCAEYACKWTQKISEHSHEDINKKYAVERLTAIVICAEHEIKILTHEIKMEVPNDKT